MAYIHIQYISEYTTKINNDAVTIWRVLTDTGEQYYVLAKNVHYFAKSGYYVEQRYLFSKRR